MTILVTGGAGFIGSHLIQALQAAGHSVVNVDQVNDYYDIKFKEYNLSLLADQSNYTFYKKDINDAVAIAEILKQHQPEVIVHLGAQAGVRLSMVEPALYQRVNYEGTKQLATLADQYGVRQFIFGSTSAVYGNSQPPFSEAFVDLHPISNYAVTKLMAEGFLRELHTTSKLKFTILRFFTVYGERGRPDMAPYLFTKAILNHDPIKKFGDGNSSRDYTYIGDIVQGILAAIEHPFDFEIINLGNHRPVSLNEFIETVEGVTGKTANIVPAEHQAGDVDHTLADISKAQRLLGYQPTTSLEQGLQKFVSWYKANRL